MNNSQVQSNLLKLISMVLKPVRNNFCFFVFMYILGVVTIIIEVVTLHLSIPRFNFFSLILDIYILCLILAILPRRAKRFFVLLVFFIAYVLAIINAFCVEHFYARIGPDILNVVLETNPRESSEFLHKYIGMELLWSGTGAIIALMFFHIVFAKWFRKRHFLVLKKNHYVVQLFLFFLLISSFLLCTHSRISALKLMFVSTAEEADLLVNNFSQNTPLNNLLFSIKMREISNNGLTTLADVQDQAYIDSCTYMSDLIVLIIGESYIKCHSQLYGYNKKTTPMQKKRAEMSENGCLIPFSDVISPSNLTSIVFKNSFSLHSIDEKDDWSGFPLFPVLFKRAGYKVFFITNQFVQSMSTDIFNLSGGLFINHSRLNESQFDYRNTKSHQYDLALTNDYDSLKQFKGDHNFIIFHLSGQHIDFDKRSPIDYKVFRTLDYKDRKDLNESEKQLVADYDNATYYNDIVVDSIIKLFEKDNAIVIYMPDHGEECYDELHRMGRLPSDNYSPEALRQEYRIPFWIWCSKTYIESHQEVFNQIESSSERAFMTDDLPHLLLYLAGISCKYYDETRNLISPSFNLKRKRLINGKCDFDKTINGR